MKTKKISFISFLNKRINYLSECQRYGTAVNYRRALVSLEKYLNGRNLSFCKVTPAFVDDYQDWLLKRGMIRNSVSFHLRILRAVYNKGVRQGLVKQSFPFRNSYTGIDKTKKRCVPEIIIKKLISLPIEENLSLSLTRDIFLFALFSRGMAFIDIAHLRKENIHNNEIVYIRKKTGQQLSVKIEAPMRAIIKKYAGSSEYLFPVLKEEGSLRHKKMDSYSAYTRALGRYNYRLRLLSKMIGQDVRLTSYTSRHTWANLARKMKVPIAVISQGMGHTSIRTTEIYLDTLDQSMIHQANHKIISAFL